MNLGININEIWMALKGSSVENSVDFEDPKNIELFRAVNDEYASNLRIYSKIYDYYKGDTDAKRNYLAKIAKDEKTKIFTNINFFKKFVKEEVAYTCGNAITYESISGNTGVISQFMKDTYHWRGNHDADLMKYLIIFGETYELYYRNKDNKFSARGVSPLEGYVCRDFNGNVLYFVHVHTSRFKEEAPCDDEMKRYEYRKYYDVYTTKYIYRFNDSYDLIKNDKGTYKEPHKFDGVPVGIGILSREGYKDTLFADVKGLQDALETNLSDMGNEISDFRNAFLAFVGCDVKNDDLVKFNELGAIKVPKASGKEDVKWLIKDINDTFMQNTLNRYIDLLYQITSHINHNEKMQSNLSSLTLRARLTELEEKCALNIAVHRDILKARMKFYCQYVNAPKIKKVCEHEDIKITYTAKVPQDDLVMAQIISQLDDRVISKSTARAQFSFVNNPQTEEDKIKKEMAENEGLYNDPYKDNLGDNSNETE